MGRRKNIAGNTRAAAQEVNTRKTEENFTSDKKEVQNKRSNDEIQADLDKYFTNPNTNYASSDKKNAKIKASDLINEIPNLLTDPSEVNFKKFGLILEAFYVKGLLNRDVNDYANLDNNLSKLFTNAGKLLDLRNPVTSSLEPDEQQNLAGLAAKQYAKSIINKRFYTPLFKYYRGSKTLDPDIFNHIICDFINKYNYEDLDLLGDNIENLSPKHKDTYKTDLLRVAAIEFDGYLTQNEAANCVIDVDSPLGSIVKFLIEGADPEQINIKESDPKQINIKGCLNINKKILRAIKKAISDQGIASTADFFEKNVPLLLVEKGSGYLDFLEKEEWIKNQGNASVEEILKKYEINEIDPKKLLNHKQNEVNEINKFSNNPLFTISNHQLTQSCLGKRQYLQASHNDGQNIDIEESTNRLLNKEKEILSSRYHKFVPSNIAEKTLSALLKKAIFNNDLDEVKEIIAIHHMNCKDHAGQLDIYKFKKLFFSLDQEKSLLSWAIKGYKSSFEMMEFVFNIGKSLNIAPYDTKDLKYLIELENTTRIKNNEILPEEAYIKRVDAAFAANLPDLHREFTKNLYPYHNRDLTNLEDLTQVLDESLLTLLNIAKNLSAETKVDENNQKITAQDNETVKAINNIIEENKFAAENGMDTEQYKGDRNRQFLKLMEISLRINGILNKTELHCSKDTHDQLTSKVRTIAKKLSDNLNNQSSIVILPLIFFKIFINKDEQGLQSKERQEYCQRYSKAFRKILNHYAEQKELSLVDKEMALITLRLFQINILSNSEIANYEKKYQEISNNVEILKNANLSENPIKESISRIALSRGTQNLSRKLPSLDPDKDFRQCVYSAVIDDFFDVLNSRKSDNKSHNFIIRLLLNTILNVQLADRYEEKNPNPDIVKKYHRLTRMLTGTLDHLDLNDDERMEELIDEIISAKEPSEVIMIEISLLFDMGLVKINQLQKCAEKTTNVELKKRLNDYTRPFTENLTGDVVISQKYLNESCKAMSYLAEYCNYVAILEIKKTLSKINHENKQKDQLIELIEQSLKHVNPYFDDIRINLTIDSIINAAHQVLTDEGEIKKSSNRILSLLIENESFKSISIIFTLDKLKIEPFTNLENERSSIFHRLIDQEINFQNTDQKLELLTYLLQHPKFKDEKLAAGDLDKILEIAISYDISMQSPILQALFDADHKIPDPQFATNRGTFAKKILLSANFIKDETIVNILQNCQGYPFEKNVITKFFKEKTISVSQDCVVNVINSLPDKKTKEEEALDKENEKIQILTEASERRAGIFESQMKLMNTSIKDLQKKNFNLIAGRDLRDIKIKELEAEIESFKTENSKNDKTALLKRLSEKDDEIAKLKSAKNDEIAKLKSAKNDEIAKLKLSLEKSRLALKRSQLDLVEYKNSSSAEIQELKKGNGKLQGKYGALKREFAKLEDKLRKAQTKIDKKISDLEKNKNKAQINKEYSTGTKEEKTGLEKNIKELNTELDVLKDQFNEMENDLNRNIEKLEAELENKRGTESLNRRLQEENEELIRKNNILQADLNETTNSLNETTKNLSETTQILNDSRITNQQISDASQHDTIVHQDHCYQNNPFPQNQPTNAELQAEVNKLTHLTRFQKALLDQKNTEPSEEEITGLKQELEITRSLAQGSFIKCDQLLGQTPQIKNIINRNSLNTLQKAFFENENLSLSVTKIAIDGSRIYMPLFGKKVGQDSDLDIKIQISSDIESESNTEEKITQEQKNTKIQESLTKWLEITFPGKKIQFKAYTTPNTKNDNNAPNINFKYVIDGLEADVICCYPHYQSHPLSNIDQCKLTIDGGKGIELIDNSSKEIEINMAKLGGKNPNTAITRLAKTFIVFEKVGVDFGEIFNRQASSEDEKGFLKEFLENNLGKITQKVQEIKKDEKLTAKITKTIKEILENSKEVVAKPKPSISDASTVATESNRTIAQQS